MKKLLSTFLAASLLTAAGTPALAAERLAEAPAVPAAEEPVPAESGTAGTVSEMAAPEGGTTEAPSGSTEAFEARLTAVTQAVKAKLSIGDEFTQFHGEPNENEIAPRWDLNWQSEGYGISVTAGDDGKVYAYNVRRDDEESTRFWGLNAAFPKADKAAALTAAQRFTDSLLGENESVELESAPGSTDGLTFTGTLQFRGLVSPVSVRVQLRTEDLTPYYFRRDDCYTTTYPEVPETASVVTAEEAGKLLRSTLQLTPCYVRGKNRKMAELRYILETEGDYVVTVSDGKLVDLTKVYSSLARDYSSTKASSGGAMMNAYAEDDGAAVSGAPAAAPLSDTEIKAIESLRDVHSREQLDTALRAVPALGLDSAWALERVNYSQDTDSGKVTATLRYTRPLTDEEREKVTEEYGELPEDGEMLQVRKNISVDARTDELQSVNTYASYWYGESQKAQTESQRAAAEAFLQEQLPVKWEQSAPYEKDGKDRLRYAQSVNGYLFRDNQIAVRMDENNVVEWLNVSWDDKVTFGSADGILSAEEAADACYNVFEMPLSYIEYPVMENRVFASRYVAAYAFRQKENQTFGGIDAKTGEAIWNSWNSTAEYAYNDLSGAFGRTQIEALAAYGIGLSGGSFQPKATLDQKTMLTLLLSACGYKYDPEEEEGLDNLYRMAYSENLVKAADRDPEAAVTRLAFLKTLLGASAYGEAAKVQGIYTCPFADRKKLSREDYGYAALAYGLGVARGDEKGRLNPDSIMTRQEAAVMLYNFMMR